MDAYFENHSRPKDQRFMLGLTLTAVDGCVLATAPGYVGFAIVINDTKIVEKYSFRETGKFDIFCCKSSPTQIQENYFSP